MATQLRLHVCLGSDGCRGWWACRRRGWGVLSVVETHWGRARSAGGGHGCPLGSIICCSHEGGCPGSRPGGVFPAASWQGPLSCHRVVSGELSCCVCVGGWLVLGQPRFPSHSPRAARPWEDSGDFVTGVSALWSGLVGPTPPPTSRPMVGPPGVTVFTGPQHVLSSLNLLALSPPPPPPPVRPSIHPFILGHPAISPRTPSPGWPP